MTVIKMRMETQLHWANSSQCAGGGNQDNVNNLTDHADADAYHADPAQDWQHWQNMVLHNGVEQLRVWRFANLKAVPKQPVVLYGLWI